MSSRPYLRNTRRDFEKYFVAAILTPADTVWAGIFVRKAFWSKKKQFLRS